MTTLRCTAKLMKRLGIRSPGEPPPPENILGDWFANIIYTRQGHFVLLVSERTLLPVLTTARDLDNLVPRFKRQLSEMLSTLGVPRERISREISAMEPLYFGRTNNRSILGSMNDFVDSFRYQLAMGHDYSVLDWSLRLAITPCGPFDRESPDRLTQSLFKTQHNFRVIEGGSPQPE
jgi:hypothetical protein